MAHDLKPAALKDLKPETLFIWKKGHVADLVAVNSLPTVKGSKRFVTITPTKGVAFETEVKYLFVYDVPAVEAHIKVLRKAVDATTADARNDALAEAQTQYHGLPGWTQQLVNAAVVRRMLRAEHLRALGLGEALNLGRLA